MPAQAFGEPLKDGYITGFLPETFVDGFHDPAAVKRMKYRRLDPCKTKDGGPMHVSILSFGASSLGGCFRDDTTMEEGVQVVHAALRAGINLIDVAAWYGHGKAEEVLGQALQDVPRAAYYINTKCCRYEPDILQMFDFSSARTIQSIDESIERMGCGYLDVIQIHDPEYAEMLPHGTDIIFKETLPAMEAARKDGKVRMVGITGFPISIHRELIAKCPTGVKIDTCLSYCHYSMNDTSLTTELLPLLQEKGIALINASAISMGLLSNRGPPKWHPATPEIKDICAKAAAECQAKGVDIAKLALHFSLAEPSIPTTLVSTANLGRMKENIQVTFECA
eukprot:SAG31_NODE_4079_length_3608_cov_2.597436_1_plen_337_part_00